MLRVEDLHHSRRQRASVNHESYKILLHKVYDRIRHRASLNMSDIAYTVPPIIPGRPIYDQAHAARYITEKLQRGGFSVTHSNDQNNSIVLAVSWPPPTAKPPKAKEKAKAAKAKPTKPPAASLSERLQNLKAKLKMS